jgi:hypothetical protein
MLRESAQIVSNKVNLKDVTQGLSGETRIPNAKILMDYAEAIVSRDTNTIEMTRGIVFDVLGNDAMVDAAAVASAFHGFVRIADTIGIPYDKVAQGQDVSEMQEEAGINKFYRITGSS